MLVDDDWSEREDEGADRSDLLDEYCDIRSPALKALPSFVKANPSAFTPKNLMILGKSEEESVKLANLEARKQNPLCKEYWKSRGYNKEYYLPIIQEKLKKVVKRYKKNC